MVGNLGLNVARHWHTLPKEVVNGPSLKAFKPRFNGTLGSLTCWVATLPMEGLELDSLNDLSLSVITGQLFVLGRSLTQGECYCQTPTRLNE